MAGDWIKLQKDTFDKPEVLAIAARLGLDQDAVVGKLCKIWAWFDTHTVDGNADSVTFAFFDRLAGVTGFTEQVALVGWIHQNGQTLSLKNFVYHNGETAKSRALGKNRTEKYRINAKSNAASVTKPSPEKRREENRREEDINTEERSRKHSQPAVSEFVLPDWINKQHWDAWHSCPKRKKATDAQKQMAVDKLAAWRAKGVDYAAALENAAIGGWQGLFEPDAKNAARAGHKPAKHMTDREREDYSADQAQQAKRLLFGDEVADVEMPTLFLGVNQNAEE